MNKWAILAGDFAFMGRSHFCVTAQTPANKDKGRGEHENSPSICPL
jgi:hypothetical protein